MTIIYDNGNIRRCPSNRLELGYWKSLWHFHGYRELIREFPVDDLIGSVVIVSNTIVWICLFPVLPLIHCWYQHSAAVKEEAYWLAERNRQDNST